MGVLPLVTKEDNLHEKHCSSHSKLEWKSPS